ncbi:MAG: hypothetical protein IPH68_12935 [Chitinophagaceae bacterium]|nr:hypothetical protein [Chitinophagaceae bacterium]
MFLFYNKKEKTLEYRSYNFEGKMISTYTKELTNRSKMLLEQTYGQKSDEGQNEALFSVQDQGYVTVYPVKEGKYYTYEVNFFLPTGASNGVMRLPKSRTTNGLRPCSWAVPIRW